MKPILHATDLSPASVAALKLAHALSRASGTTLVVLHAFETPTIVSSSVETSTLQMTDREVHQLELVRLKTFCREHLGEPALEHVRFRVKEGAPAGTIERVADEIDASPIIVGTRGESRVRELLMGSTAKRLLKECGRPVLVVPAGARPGAPKKLMQAVTMEEIELEAIKQGLHFADAWGAKLTVVHVADSNDTTAHGRMAELIARVGQETGRRDIAHEIVRAGDRSISESMDLHMRTHACDLLLMQKHRDRGMFDAWFGSDIVESTALHTSVPTLVMPVS
jgi:nucleotide-binding universal stress UspA family protein